MKNLNRVWNEWCFSSYNDFLSALCEVWKQADKRRDWRVVHFGLATYRLAHFYDEDKFDELGWLLEIAKIRAAMNLN